MINSSGLDSGSEKEEVLLEQDKQDASTAFGMQAEPKSSSLNQQNESQSVVSSITGTLFGGKPSTFGTNPFLTTPGPDGVFSALSSSAQIARSDTIPTSELFGDASKSTNPFARAWSPKPCKLTQDRSLKSSNPEKRPQRTLSPSKSMQKTSVAGEAVSFSSGSVSKATTSTKSSGSQKDFTTILSQVSRCDSDRLDILDARDKLIRQRFVHHQGDTLKGTCPDMCPERERYMRSAKNQLRMYEKLNDDVNHLAMLKEYSRSSADQDLPLPHELRPSNILIMAMDHLICNVIGRIESNISSWSMEEWYAVVQETGQAPAENAIPANGGSGKPENLGEWFEFVWSATRSIRKDITQQQLSDPKAVALVEKCTRLHIMCTTRLIEEDAHRFDRKLNDENLTKCLQTLKHMYEDLHVEGVSCPSEAEFRAYDVLMNLNDGDTLRGVQNLKPEVRDSRQIKMALELFSALNSNNYVRFFHLVHKVDLLQACILQRYFYQVRKRAINVILKGYVSNSNRVVKMPLTHMCSLLAFEDVQECSQCFRLHGIESEVSSNTIYLDRSTLEYPSSIPAIKRAKNIIESKRTSPWAEVINGGALPVNPYVYYKPHNSFDENGLLFHAAYDASDQEGDTVVDAANPATRDDVEDQMTILKQLLNAVAELTVIELMEEIITDEAETLMKNVIRDHEHDEVAEQLVKELIVEVELSLAAVVAQETIREAKNAELNRKLHLEEMISQAGSFLDDLIQEVVQEEVNPLSEAIVAAVHQQRLQEMYDNFAQDLLSDLCSDVAGKEAALVVAEVRQAMEEERQAMIDSFIHARNMRQVRRIFQDWHYRTMKRRLRAENLKNFPPMPFGPKCTQMNENRMPCMPLNKYLKLTEVMEDNIQMVDFMNELIDEVKLEIVVAVAKGTLHEARNAELSEKFDLENMAEGFLDNLIREVVQDEAGLLSEATIGIVKRQRRLQDNKKSKLTRSGLSDLCQNKRLKLTDNSRKDLQDSMSKLEASLQSEKEDSEKFESRLKAVVRNDNL